jgi:hypothetical protein
VRRNDEVAAQRRRWTFYETITFLDLHYALCSAEFFALDVSIPERAKFFPHFEWRIGNCYFK